MNQSDLYTFIESLTIKELATFWTWLNKIKTATYDLELLDYYRILSLFDGLLQYHWMETQDDNLKSMFYAQVKDWTDQIPDDKMNVIDSLVQEYTKQSKSLEVDMGLVKQEFINEKLGIMGLKRSI